MHRFVLFAGIALALQTPQADDAREAVAGLRQHQYEQGLEIGCSLRITNALVAQDEVALAALQDECAALTRRDATVGTG